MKNLMIINTNHIIYNINTIKKKTKKDIMCVLKSNAYNLGVKNIIKTLLKAQVNFFVFNHYLEYLACKELLRNQKVLILETIESKYFEKIPANVRISVNSFDQAKELLQINQNICVHIQIDTKMNRDGLKTINELKETINLFKTKKNIYIEGIYTHFIGDKNDLVHYEQQRKTFLEFVNLYAFPIVHSAATSSLSKDIIGNYVRIGMGLYGYHTNLELKPAVKIFTMVSNVRKIVKGESIGYSAKYTSSQDELIGVLPIGYYEGFKGNSVYKNSIKYDVVGQICMNHTFIRIDKTIKKGTWLNILPINDKIEEEMNYYHILTACRNFSRIYVTEYNNDIRKIFKNPNQKGFKLKQRS